MTDREAMRLALEALESCDVDYDSEENPYNTFDAEDVSEAIEALRQALAQPEQEPVAWMQIGVSDEYKGVVLPTMKKPKEYNRDWWRFEPLYTAPPKREWVSLTGDEIDDIAAESGFGYINVARAIEAKLKELNHV